MPVLFLVSPHGILDLSSLATNQTHAPCSGSLKSQPLGCQGRPHTFFLSEKLLINVYVHRDPL